MVRFIFPSTEVVISDLQWDIGRRCLVTTVVAWLLRHLHLPTEAWSLMFLVMAQGRWSGNRYICYYMFYSLSADLEKRWAKWAMDTPGDSRRFLSDALDNTSLPLDNCWAIIILNQTVGHYEPLDSLGALCFQQTCKPHTGSQAENARPKVVIASTKAQLKASTVFF